MRWFHETEVRGLRARCDRRRIPSHSAAAGRTGHVRAAVIVFSLLCAASGTLQAASVDHQSVPMINVTAGKVGVLRSNAVEDRERVGVEYRFREFGAWRLIPAVGYARARNGASFLYADVRHDFWLSNHWIVIPSFGLGNFKGASNLDLGLSLEFRSGLELAYRFNNDFRVGIALFHLSNGSLGSHNPGTEALVMSVCIPVTRKSR